MHSPFSFGEIKILTFLHNQMVNFVHVHTICFEKFENAVDFLSIACSKLQIPMLAFGQSIGAGAGGGAAGGGAAAVAAAGTATTRQTPFVPLGIVALQ